MVGMRAFLSAMLALSMLAGLPATALAEDGAPARDDVRRDDPGIVALHDAITDFRDATADLRAECKDVKDKEKWEKCGRDFAVLRAKFKEQRRRAIDLHHAFREAQKDKKSEERAKEEKAKEKPKPRGKPEPLQGTLRSFDERIAALRERAAKADQLAAQQRERAATLESEAKEKALRLAGKFDAQAASYRALAAKFEQLRDKLKAR